MDIGKAFGTDEKTEYKEGVPFWPLGGEEDPDSPVFYVRSIEYPPYQAAILARTDKARNVHKLYGKKLRQFQDDLQLELVPKFLITHWSNVTWGVDKDNKPLLFPYNKANGAKLCKGLPKLYKRILLFAAFLSTPDYNFSIQEEEEEEEEEDEAYTVPTDSSVVEMGKKSKSA